MSCLGVRLAWVTQGSGHGPWRSPGPRLGQRAKKGGAPVSLALASLVLEGQVACPFRPASA